MGMESEYLDWLRRRVPQNNTANKVLVGIGDDAAVVEATQARVHCTDLLVEGVHFRSEDKWALVGRKALAVNLSDMAAMAARPRFALLSLVVNRARGLQQAMEVSEGLLDLAKDFQVKLIGGDTCSHNGPLMVSVSVMGDLIQDQPVLRRGAEPGDCIVVSGKLGGSIHGRHLTFTPRCQLIEAILQTGRPSALTDISDGLARDLYSIVEASRVRAVLEAIQIPISDDAKRESSKPVGLSAIEAIPGLHQALNDGEDFELLMTFHPEDWKQVQAQQETADWPEDCRLTQIGNIEPGKDVMLRLGKDTTQKLLPGGYDH